MKKENKGLVVYSFIYFILIIIIDSLCVSAFYMFQDKGALIFATVITSVTLFVNIITALMLGENNG